MNLRQLRYFVAAVDAGNITRAARQVHVAQPALGVQLRELEEELGASLLVRHSRGVEPTPAGRLFYERSKAMLDLLERTRHDVLQLQAAARLPLRLGLTSSLVMLVGTDLQLLASRAFPRIALSPLEAPSFALADAVAREELDLALAYDVEPLPGLSIMPVMREELLFVRARESDKPSSPVDLGSVLASRLALGGCRDVARRALARALGTAPAELPLAFEMQSVSAIRELVLRGEATSVLPIGAVAAEVAAGRIQVHRIIGTTATMTLHVVRRSSGSTPATQEISELLEAALSMIADKAGKYVSREVPAAARLA